MFQKSYQNFIFSLILVVITAISCSYFNRIGMANFYHQIKLSPLTPPDYIFPLVWTILYVMLILAFDIILNIHDKPIKSAVWLFICNLVLQILWTAVFFGYGNFLGGLIIIVALDIATAILIDAFYKLRKAATFMLLPYFLWLLFATYLNWCVYDLNGIVVIY